MSCYISYRYAGNGVIAYDYYKVTDWEQVGEYAKNIIGAVAIAGVAYAVVQSGGAAASLLVPVLQGATGG